MIEKQKAEVARPRYDTLVVKNADSAAVLAGCRRRGWHGPGAMILPT